VKRVLALRLGRPTGSTGAFFLKGCPFEMLENPCLTGPWPCPL
jgi:hypothetical protein